MKSEDLRYIVVTDKDPDSLSVSVSQLMVLGWKLHGELKLQPLADTSALTFARLYYMQALYREDAAPVTEGAEGE